jgi:hypothetical protein
MTNNYYMLTNKIFDILFIPEDEFDETFDIKDNHSVKFKNIEWHIMSGGEDTYLQGYCFQHGRSGFKYGLWEKYPITIIGSYKLDWDG